MRKLFLLIILPLCIFSACNQGALGDEDSPADGLTAIGTPITQLPDPSPSVKSLVEKYLAGHPYWKGNRPSQKKNKFDDMVLMKMDVAQLTAEIISLENSTPVKFGFEILDDGSIINTDSYAPFDLSNFVNAFSEEYRVEMTISDIRLMASETIDPDYIDIFPDTEKLCLDSGLKQYDSDVDLVGNGQYFVRGFVQTRDFYGNDCKRKIYDFCKIEGQELGEIAEDNDAGNPFGFTVKYVGCNCQGGKCEGTLPEKPMEFKSTPTDVCGSGDIFIAFNCSDNIDDNIDFLINATPPDCQPPGPPPSSPIVPISPTEEDEGKTDLPFVDIPNLW